MFAHHARNSFGGLRLIKWVLKADSTIVHDVNINVMKDASGILGVAEYVKENEAKILRQQYGSFNCSRPN